MLASMLTRFGAIDPETLGAVLAAWPTASAPPRFLGKPKKDLPIDEWITLISEGAKAQGIQQVLWPEVAKHFMSDKARARVQELEAVMRCVYGTRWMWRWSAFGAALKNMSWNIDTNKMKVVTFDKSSGIWATIGRRLGQRPQDTGAAPSSVVPKDKAVAKNKVVSKDKATPKVNSPKEISSKKAADKPRPQLKKAATAPSPPKSDKQEGHAITRTLTRLAVPLHLAPTPPPPPTTVTAQIPLWLLAASEAMVTLMPDYSTTMSVISAVLITVGSIPALPAVSAGATAHALGSAAVGLGAVLRDRAQAGGRT